MIKNYLIDRKLFQQDLFNLATENKFIDKFIQESQQNAKYTNQILEWIPYNKFKNIEYLDKGGFSTVYKAVWSDGPIIKWSSNEEKWIRRNDKTVSLKNLNESSNLNEEFLNEV